jgi:hypothetical protein
MARKWVTSFKNIGVLVTIMLLISYFTPHSSIVTHSYPQKSTDETLDHGENYDTITATKPMNQVHYEDEEYESEDHPDEKLHDK